MWDAWHVSFQSTMGHVLDFRKTLWHFRFSNKGMIENKLIMGIYRLLKKYSVALNRWVLFHTVRPCISIYCMFSIYTDVVCVYIFSNLTKCGKIVPMLIIQAANYLFVETFFSLLTMAHITLVGLALLCN